MCFCAILLTVACVGHSLSLMKNEGKLLTNRASLALVLAAEVLVLIAASSRVDYAFQLPTLRSRRSSSLGITCRGSSGCQL